MKQKHFTVNKTESKEQIAHIKQMNNESKADLTYLRATSFGAWWRSCMDELSFLS